ncbi:hypothetical protein ANCCEY_10410 [Ancylostoma ceylanicum]|uniref:glucuronosyltransferase n=1 Tax=Ancylostoma ceylanicum TaxID=53326 RepID=A0A0D6LKH3_9BILA|nr:hypothetical protein ANCCEY_10410 [Ancylostoma ceylanicum]
MAPEMFESPHSIGFQYFEFCLDNGSNDPDLLSRATTQYRSSIERYYTKGYDMQSFDVGDFWGRLKTMRDVIAEQYIINIAANRWLMKAGELLNTTSSYRELFETSYGTFMDFPSRYAYPASYCSSIIHVGEHCQEPNELPPDLRKFVEDPNSKGTIYIAFGSIVNWRVSPPEVKDIKPHVKILAWAPQNDILAHNKTILFFTHGGLKSYTATCDANNSELQD